MKLESRNLQEKLEINMKIINIVVHFVPGTSVEICKRLCDFV